MNNPLTGTGGATQADSASASLADLKTSSVRGGVASMAAQGMNTVIQIISTVILARLLSPEDFGVLAMVASVTALAALFQDLGLSFAAIQKKDLTRAQQSNLFWLNVAAGTTLTIVVASASPLVAAFYGQPELVWVTVAVSFSFLIGSLGSQHGAMMVRNMKVGRKAMISVAGGGIGLVVSVVLALMGYSYWSLVWGNLAGSVCVTVLLTAMSPFRPGFPSRGTGIREMLKFGAHLTAFDFVNYFSRNLDNVLIGKFWGTDALGLYSKAYGLFILPIQKIRGPIHAVAYPALSRLQDEPTAYREYYVKIMSALAFLTMPLTALLFCVADELIRLLLGPEWTEAGKIYSVLAIAAFIHPISSLRAVIILSRGDGRRYFMQGLFATIGYVAGFVVGLPWGPVGVAAGYTVAQWLLFIPMQYYCTKGSPVRVWDTVSAIWKAAVLSILAGATAETAVALVELPSDWVIVLYESAIFMVAAASMFGLLPFFRQERTDALGVAETLLARKIGRRLKPELATC